MSHLFIAFFPFSVLLKVTWNMVSFGRSLATKVIVI